MDTVFVMPQLGNEIEEALVETWAKAPGDSVTKGEMLVTIVTPKLTMELEAPVSGVVKEIVVAADEVANVGATLAIITEG